MKGRREGTQGEDYDERRAQCGHFWRGKQTGTMLSGAAVAQDLDNGQRLSRPGLLPA